MSEFAKANERLKLVEMTDKINLSPEERASAIYAILQEKYPELTVWDLICFSANYLGFIASHEAKWLEEPAKYLCRLVYTAHYQDGGTNIDTGINTRSNGDSSLTNDTRLRSEEESSSGSIGLTQTGNSGE